MNNNILNKPIEVYEEVILPLIKGDRGDYGPTGRDGRNGDAGIMGQQGPMGENGYEGPEGIAGERGPMGENGREGRPGQRGQGGPQGANGKSAYDIAKEGGYTRTLKQFTEEQIAMANNSARLLQIEQDLATGKYTSFSNPT